jgi:hypothetical protein
MLRGADATQPDGGQAFPTHPPSITDMARRIHGEPGMSLRDYFAATVSMDGVALSALEALEGPFPAYSDAKAKQDWYARAEAAFRYHRADAMLKARES